MTFLSICGDPAWLSLAGKYVTTEATREWLFVGSSEDSARHHGSWHWPEQGPQALSRQRGRHESWRCFREERIPKWLCQPLIGICRVCEGFVFGPGCGELKIDIVIPWVRVILDAAQSPLAPLSHLSGSAATAEARLACPL